VITHETLILAAPGLPDDASLDALLGEIAELEARCAHSYFVERHVKGRSWNELKSELSRRFGLTHRQFSSVASWVDGLAKGVREGMKERRDDLKRRINSAQTAITRWEQRLKASADKDQRHRERRANVKAAALAGRHVRALPKSLRGFSPGDEAALRSDLKSRLHHKKRYIADQERRLTQLEADIGAGRIHLCFGGRRRFRAQNNLAGNDFVDQSEWLEEWRHSRASNVFCIGSRDETSGNQTASWLGAGRLRLRIPPALEARYGRHVVLLVKEFRRAGVAEQVDCIAAHGAERGADGQLVAAAQPLSWRLRRRDTKGGTTWVAQVSYEPPKVSCLSDDRIGAWGLDFNPAVVAMLRIDRFGNPVRRASYELDLQGKTEPQIAAILGDAAAWAVELARKDGVPLCAETLDFREKRSQLRERGNRYARMLSQFAYKQFHQLTDARAAAHGVAVRRVNPAFTSIIGAAKFASGYALSRHHAAACVIARRALGLSERLARRETSPSEAGTETVASRTAFPLPVRTRGKHVWTDWRRYSKELGQTRAHARAAIPVGAAGARSHPHGYGGTGKPARGAPRATTAMQGRPCRKSAKPFRWRAVVTARLLML
jgi:IS605 OrfB family transposase